MIYSIQPVELSLALEKKKKHCSLNRLNSNPSFIDIYVHRLVCNITIA